MTIWAARFQKVGRRQAAGRWPRNKSGAPGRALRQSQNSEQSAKRHSPLTMKISTRQPSAGIALLIVMCAIFVLSILAAGLAYSMKVESTLAMHSDTNQRLVWLGRSGVEIARWVLAQEANTQPFDSLNQIWAGGSGTTFETNSALAGINLKNYPIGDGTVSVTITDLERFANINGAGTRLLKRPV